MGDGGPSARFKCTKLAETKLRPTRSAVYEALVDGHGVECRSPDRDRYRRWLAVCWRDDGFELNAEMVRLGWALTYRPGNDPFPRPEYEPQEADARAAGRGMWRGTFIPPWEWRQR